MYSRVHLLYAREPICLLSALEARDSLTPQAGAVINLGGRG